MLKKRNSGKRIYGNLLPYPYAQSIRGVSKVISTFSPYFGFDLRNPGEEGTELDTRIAECWEEDPTLFHTIGLENSTDYPKLEPLILRPTKLKVLVTQTRIFETMERLGT